MLRDQGLAEAETEGSREANNILIEPSENRSCGRGPLDRKNSHREMQRGRERETLTILSPVLPLAKIN